MTQTPLSRGAQYLKRGDTFDPEDHRMTHRLREARAMLAAAGYVPEKHHVGLYADEPMHFRFHIEQFCGEACKTTWPADVTDEMFQTFFDAADALQNARHAATTRAINERESRRYR